MMIKTQINYFELFIENLLNALNLNFVKFNKKIIHINDNDDVFVNKHIEIDIEKNEMTFFKKNCENIILHLK